MIWFLAIFFMEFQWEELEPTKVGVTILGRCTGFPHEVALFFDQNCRSWLVFIVRDRLWRWDLRRWKQWPLLFRLTQWADILGHEAYCDTVWTTKSPIWVSSWCTCSRAIFCMFINFRSFSCIFRICRLVDRFRIGTLVSGSKQYDFPLNPVSWTDNQGFGPMSYTCIVLNQHICMSILKWHCFIIRCDTLFRKQSRMSTEISLWVADS